MRPLLFDASVLIALFNGTERASASWFQAEHAGATVLLPAGAIAVANQQLQASDNAWAAILLGPNVCRA